MGRTKIEWCDDSINFITGCRNKCSYCYARGTAQRNARMGSARYVAAKEATGDAFAPTYHEHIMKKERERLARATKPLVIFLGSMSDPFTEGDWLFLDDSGNAPGSQGAKDLWVQHMIAEFCAGLPRHTFILLTKKPDNILYRKWPKNVWIGTSVADYAGAEQRIPVLLSADYYGQEAQQLSVGGLLLSIEPLQGGPDPERHVSLQYLETHVRPGWIIVGSQTRPKISSQQQFHVIQNATEIVEQCSHWGIPCFVKDNLRILEPSYNWPQEFPAAFKKGDN